MYKLRSVPDKPIPLYDIEQVQQLDRQPAQFAAVLIEQIQQFFPFQILLGR